MSVLKQIASHSGTEITHLAKVGACLNISKWFQIKSVGVCARTMYVELWHGVHQGVVLDPFNFVIATLWKGTNCAVLVMFLNVWN